MYIHLKLKNHILISHPHSQMQDEKWQFCCFALMHMRSKMSMHVVTYFFALLLRGTLNEESTIVTHRSNKARLDCLIKVNMRFLCPSSLFLSMPCRGRYGCPLFSSFSLFCLFSFVYFCCFVFMSLVHPSIQLTNQQSWPSSISLFIDMVSRAFVSLDRVWPQPSFPI